MILELDIVVSDFFLSYRWLVDTAQSKTNMDSQFGANHHKVNDFVKVVVEIKRAKVAMRKPFFSTSEFIYLFPFIILPKQFCHPHTTTVVLCLYKSYSACTWTAPITMVNQPNTDATTLPLPSIWIPKVAHIQGHLIFKLIILRYWLIHFIIQYIFLLVILIFKTLYNQVPFVLNLYSSHIKHSLYHSYISNH